MRYKFIFTTLLFVCSITGFLIAIFNNNIIDIRENYNSNIKDNNNNEINRNQNNYNNDEDKKKLLNIHDFINEEDEEENDNNESEDKYINIKENNKKQKEEDKNIKDNYKNELKDKNKNSEKHIINLALNIDSKYVYPCIVFLTSLLENRSDKTFYQIYILISETINEGHISKINTLIDKYGKNNLGISFISMENDFYNAITSEHISTSAYYRIALPSLLPNIDKIIYSDTDVVNFVDLTELYNLELKDNIYYMGILDNTGLLEELSYLGIDSQKYMNSGIVLMNLKAQRENNIEEKIRQFINENYLDHHDQTAINGICYNNFEILSIKYATFNWRDYNDLLDYNQKQDKRYRYSETELKQAFYEPHLLHFVGWDKPWDFGSKAAFREYWWYFAKKSDFYNEILEFYNYYEFEIEDLLDKIPSDGGLLRRNYKQE